ncbi:sugar transferase [Megasphaera vaginalis (ex Bordigoni et al. 2020)]|uniref:sugar transferase n=1 Tax=Megasphaera vaginalis (ex Bordigoni et al. 2020) TaxID=2045301 RepID=UPI000C7DF6FB|nr:sugar transferase [Megasphaera vaginalis (ex Bordigoni et al. 2020)]
MCQWDELPMEMQNPEVKIYYDILVKKRNQLLLKAVFDKITALCLLIFLSPVFLLLALLIKADSKGPVFFRQERVTQYGRPFRIYKFRTMVDHAEKLGTQVTTQSDSRITNIGNKLRGCRLDELPQLINILKGEMSFVGTRPEVMKYVKAYTPEMMATLLLPAGVTSDASIAYKDEEKLLADTDNADETYIQVVLPQKMKFNLQSIKNFSFLNDILTMFRTVGAVS